MGGSQISIECHGRRCFQTPHWHRYVRRLVATPADVQGVSNLVQPRHRVLGEEWLGEIPVVLGYHVLSAGSTTQADRVDLGS